MASDLYQTTKKRGSKKSNENLPVPALTIINHPMVARIGQRAFLSGAVLGQAMWISRVELDFLAQGSAMGYPLADPFISRQPFEIRPDGDGLLMDVTDCPTEICVNGEPLRGSLRIDRQEIDRGVALTLAERAVLWLHWATPKLQSDSDLGMLGHSDGLHRLRREIQRVADMPVSVLIRGATGTGKELTARAVHECGGGQGPFVVVNMATIPDSLAASELFGSVRGAYTGSQRDQPGLFRRAHGGTLFLDEIGEASPTVQALLLRALETGEITPVGGQTAVRVKLRLIAATDADLEDNMERDSFKTPLFYRLSGYELHLPPLHQRREDLGLLFFGLATSFYKEIGVKPPFLDQADDDEPWLPCELTLRLLGYDWPGNVRELRNLVHQLVIENPDQAQLRATEKIRARLSVERIAPTKVTLAEKPSKLATEELKALLESNGWDIKATALQLGISRGALYRRIKKEPDIRLVADLSDGEIQAALARSDGDTVSAAADLGVSMRALARRLGKDSSRPQTEHEP